MRVVLSSSSSVSVPQVVRLKGYSGKISVPVLRRQYPYAQMPHVKGVPVKEGEAPKTALIRLRTLNAIIGNLRKAQRLSQKKPHVPPQKGGPRILRDLLTDRYRAASFSVSPSAGESLFRARKVDLFA